MTEKFRVEKVERTVTVNMTDGSTLVGKVFLAGVSPLHGGIQTLAELLDEAADFLPVVDMEGDFVLTGKAAIATISYERSESDVLEFVRRVPAKFSMLGGSMVEGELMVPEGPASFRGSDYVNSGERWFRVESDHTVTLVGGGAVSGIRL